MVVDGERRLSRLRASFGTQANALSRKNFSFQKRRWAANLCLLAAPFVICMLLWLLQEVINKQLDSRSFRCGCQCLSCCDWVPVTGDNRTSYSYECYDASSTRQCSPYADCKAYNDTECGYLYSTADQVGFCPVVQPPLWPALLQVPLEQDRGSKYPDVQPEGIDAQVPASDAAVLYTGDDPAMAAKLAAALWERRDSITMAVMQSYQRAQAAGQNIPGSTGNASIANESQFVEATSALAQGLFEFDLVMGTAATTSVSLLMEPAFVAQGSNSSGSPNRPPLYFALNNCSALTASDQSTLQQIGEAITNMTGFPVACASLPPAWQNTSMLMNDQVYCGWGSSDCIVRSGQKVVLSAADKAAAGNIQTIQGFVSALFDWHDSGAAGLNVDVWVNNSNVAKDQGQTSQGPPDVQRWNQPMNMAANAYLKVLKGANYSARLVGVKDMPKGSSRLSLDFSSLLGPLLMMWFMQLLLPVNVYTLVSEKEQHLMRMMRMQGLRDGVYFGVQYTWMYLTYCVFMCVFVLFGSLIGLKIFTLNSLSVQVVFYAIWGFLLTSWSFYFASLASEARPAVLLAVIWVIVSGFVANLVLVQYIERGPDWLAKLMEFIPSFGLFRGLYELAQYAFLADRTGGTGLTWDKLTDSNNDMLAVWIIWAIEAILMPFWAYYIDQVTGGGIGARKHPLFLFGVQYTEKPVARRWWQKKSQRISSDPPATSVAAIQSGIAVAGGVPMTPVPAVDNNSLAFYYGAESENGDLSVNYPTLIAQGLPPGDEKESPSHMGLVPRKVTSVKLTLAESEQVFNHDLQGGSFEEGCDILLERDRVAAMWSQRGEDAGLQPPAAIILHELRKLYPAKDGNAPKVAVENLSLAIERCECFGLLGPNGAGKTTTLRMLEGFLQPTSGQAIIEGYSVQNNMDEIYTLMGACPQHDLLWGGLTGREHLLFYGRLKNLQGAELHRAVDDGLRDVNLYTVANDLVSSYSGGMKRRLSVAISLVGDPLVVYLDEPSTGLDPSSRQLLWEVIRKARRDKAVVLTTHSMEEAEALCDRLGIFVDGRLRCLGNPKDLTSRFGRYLSFQLTTAAHEEAAALAIVRSMAPGAVLVYALGGTQKFELPLHEVAIDKIFERMEEVKLRGEVTLIDWGVSHASLEDIFIGLANEVHSSKAAHK